MVSATPTWIRLAATLLVGVVLLLLIGPLLVVVGVSFTGGDYIAFPPAGLSLRWYAFVLSSSTYLHAALISLELAAATTALATILGVSAAVALHRRRLPGSAALSGLFLSPLVLPSIIFALGLLMTWSTFAGRTSFLAMLLGHAVIAVPYVIRTTLAVLAEADPSVEEAARTMGAGRWQTLVHVVLPQCAGGIAAGAFFAFNISFDDAVVSLFLRTPELLTLPVQVYTQLEFSPDPSVAAVSALMIGTTVTLVLVIDRLLGIERVVG